MCKLWSLFIQQNDTQQKTTNYSSKAVKLINLTVEVKQNIYTIH